MVWCTAPTKNTEPSGFIFAACDAPTVPPAPPLLSMMIWQPSCSPTCAARGRAKTSVPPPAGNGLIQVMVPGGQPCWARATAGAASEAATPSFSTRRRDALDEWIISNSSLILRCLFVFHCLEHGFELRMHVLHQQVT